MYENNRNTWEVLFLVVEITGKVFKKSPPKKQESTRKVSPKYQERILIICELYDQKVYWCKVGG